ncbi:MAG: bifunctional oligoribonuclease/PAP phosphatase NrnA [Deltaproteobacteria bacterium]
MNRQETEGRIADIARKGKRFLMTTHVDPDADGIGSMLGFAASLRQAGKEVVMVTQDPLPAPLNQLPEADRIVQEVPLEGTFSALFVLDCGELKRMGSLRSLADRKEMVVCIDHHKTNDFFADINLVDPESSSTGELVYQILQRAGFSINTVTANNLFAAIQTDTGSFRYQNTKAKALRIAAELVERGASPWEISRIILEGYPLSRLKLLRAALETLEFYHDGKIGMMTLTSRMYQESGADRIESERFVDYPRFVSGVEISVVIRQVAEKEYKFSLRSNNQVDVADLAAHFGGGGHARAAGFERRGTVEGVTREFLKEAARRLDGISN